MSTAFLIGSNLGRHFLRCYKSTNRLKPIIFLATFQALRNLKPYQLNLNTLRVCKTLFLTGVVEKGGCKPKSHNIRPNRSKLPWKSKNYVSTEQRGIISEIDCFNYQGLYFDESRCSLKSRSNKHITSFKDCDIEKTEIDTLC